MKRNLRKRDVLLQKKHGLIGKLITLKLRGLKNFLRIISTKVEDLKYPLKKSSK